MVFGEGASEEDKEGEEAKGGGWSRASIDRLHKMDSFMCEMRRLRPMSESTVLPHSTVPFHFSTLPHPRCALARGRKLRLDVLNSSDTPQGTKGLHLLGRHDHLPISVSLFPSPNLLTK